MVQISVKTKDLRNALCICSKAVVPRKRVVNPFYASYCLRVHNNGVMDVEANHNDEFWISVPIKSCDAHLDDTADEVQEFFVCGDKIRQLVGKIGSEIVDLEFFHSQMSVSCDDFSYMIPLQEVEKSNAFAHVIVKSDSDRSVSFEVPDFKKFVANTIFCTDRSIYRPIMSGILLSLSKEHVRFVSTNAHILSVVDVKSVKADFDLDFVIPNAVCDVVFKTLPKVGFVSMKFFFDTAIISVSDGNGYKYEVHTKTIAGRYPNYEAILPKSELTNVKTDKCSLLSALERLALVSDAHKLVRFSISDDIMIMTANDSDFDVSGTERVSLSENGFSGKGKVVIGFMHEYIRDVLKRIRTKDVVFKMIDKYKAVVVCDDGLFDDNTTYVVMPMLAD